MKTIHTLLTLLAMCWWANVQSQSCTGNILSDDYSVPANWSSVGSTASGCGGSAGTLTFSNQLVFSGFRARQTQRVQQSLGGSLPGTNVFQANFDFNFSSTSSDAAALVLALTANAAHPRSGSPGGTPATNNDMIEVIVWENGPLIAQAFSKNGTTMDASSGAITLSYNTTYYGRLERWGPTDVSLSIFTDVNRTVHATGSPSCFTINADITDLDWVQQGGTSVSGCPRVTDAWIDNLCITDDLLSFPCNNCPGSFLSDGYNVPGNWAAQGATTNCAGAGQGGTITVANGLLTFDEFRSRQTTQLVQDLGGNLPGTSDFMADVSFNFSDESTSPAATVLALTATDDNPRSDVEGAATLSDNDAIELLVYENMANSMLVAQVFSKNGDVPDATSAMIGLDYNTTYYARLERFSPTLIMLSVFSDPSRTTHVANSPQCLVIDPDITDLDWVQQGGRSTSGCFRINEGWMDNLCIYDTPVSDPCTSCPINLSVNTNVSNLDCALSTGTATASTTGTVGTFASVPPYTYVWSTGATTDAITNAPFGTYTVTATDANGCSANTSVTIEGVTFTPILTPTCPGECYGIIEVSNVAGGNPPFAYEYQLDGGGWVSSNIFDNLCVGTYTVEVAEPGSNCTTSVMVTITANNGIWPKHPITNATARARAWGNSVVDEGAYVTGEFVESITLQHDFDPLLNIPLASGPGDQQGFLAKYDDCGIDWAFSFGSTSLDIDMGDVVEVYGDGADQLLILGGNINGPMPGGFQGAKGPAVTSPVNQPGISLITDLIPGVKKGFVASVNATDGSVNWFYMLGDNVSETTELTDLKVDEKGDIFVIGNFNNVVSFGPNSYTTYGDWDPMVFQLDLFGNHPAGVLNHFGTASEDRGYALDIPGPDAELRPILVATGFVDESLVNLNNLPNFPASPGNDQDIFGIALEPLPGMLTDVSFTAHRSPGNDAGLDVARASDPTVFEYYLTGYFQESLDFAASYMGSMPVSNDAFVSKHDLFSHNEFWVEPIVHDGDDAGRSLTLIGADDVYAVGNFSGNPSNSPVSAGTFGGNVDADVYLISLTQAAGLVNAVAVQDGPGTADRALDISNHQNTLYTAGAISAPGPLSFPGQVSLTANSSAEDAYFARLDLGLNFFKHGTPGSIPATAENEAEAVTPLVIYPNPTRSVFYVELEEVADITVFDLSGRIVQTLSGGQGGRIEVDLSNYPTGMYFVEVRTDNAVHRQPVIKQ